MATTLKELLDSLSEPDRGALNYAFEHGLTYHVLISDGERFVGVNVTHVPYLYPDPEISRGAWSVGRVARSVDAQFQSG